MYGKEPKNERVSQLSVTTAKPSLCLSSFFSLPFVIKYRRIPEKNVTRNVVNRLGRSSPEYKKEVASGKSINIEENIIITPTILKTKRMFI
jgi:hypothetical protein